jgi:hypothetical protein
VCFEGVRQLPHRRAGMEITYETDKVRTIWIEQIELPGLLLYQTMVSSDAISRRAAITAGSLGTRAMFSG